MSRRPYGLALMALALCLTLAVIAVPALADTVTDSASALPSWITTALALVPDPYRTAILATVGIASALDATLPHPAAGSVLAIPRSIVSVLALNFLKASNAQGQGLLTALGAAGKGATSAISSATTGILAAAAAQAVQKALAAQALPVTTMEAAISADGAQPPIPDSTTVTPVPAPAQ